MQTKYKTKNENRITALYCRLSSADGDDGESNSIGNQKKMLALKAKELGLGNIEYYVDDGYTGTNFNRPDYNRLKADIMKGRVGTVMVKDLSRLGRDYVGMGYCIEELFPMYGVRFIAMTDGVDSNEGMNDIIPFKNIMNEMYAKDISKKVRSAHKIRGQLGIPLGQPPYGYTKDPENKNRWIVDPEAAVVVKRIFHMFLTGKGPETIAHTLSEDHILYPTEYWRAKGINRGGKKVYSDPYRWNDSTIGKMLTRQEYCGDVVNFKTWSLDFKHKGRIDNPKENWKIFENVHEPIIERKDFERVQEILSRGKRRPSKVKDNKPTLFNGFLYCPDCGRKLWFHTNTSNPNIHFFSCSNYEKDFRGTCKTRHYIREEALEMIVLSELRHLASLLKKDEAEFAKMLMENAEVSIAARKRELQKEYEVSLGRMRTVDMLYEKCYEDNAIGKIADDWFIHMTSKYSAEKEELRRKIQDIQEEQQSLAINEASQEHFISSVRKFMRIDKLTPTLMNELIDRIEVYEAEGKGKNRTQRVVIFYRFTGNFLITGREDYSLTVDPQKEIQVHYTVNAVSEQAS
ncbi:MAG: recombinase family protein [Oscillospiraceae bacterium]|nr:recombinase family protein [Oscillospiraceae bacterium]